MRDSTIQDDFYEDGIQTQYFDRWGNPEYQVIKSYNWDLVDGAGGMWYSLPECLIDNWGFLLRNAV